MCLPAAHWRHAFPPAADASRWLLDIPILVERAGAIKQPRRAPRSRRRSSRSGFWNAKKNATAGAPGKRTIRPPSCQTPSSRSCGGGLPWFMCRSCTPRPGVKWKYWSGCVPVPPRIAEGKYLRAVRPHRALQHLAQPVVELVGVADRGCRDLRALRRCRTGCRAHSPCARVWSSRAGVVRPTGSASMASRMGGGSPSRYETAGWSRRRTGH